MINNNFNLGSLVKEARSIKSSEINAMYTQKSLANDIGKSRSYIGDIESGRIVPNNKLLQNIADACGVEISFFNAYLEESISKVLADFSDNTIDDVKILYKTDISDESYLINGDDDPCIELNSYIRKDDLLNDYVSDDFPAHRRIKLLMHHKNLDYAQLAKIAEVDIKDLLFLSEGILQFKEPNRKVSSSVIEKIANALDTTQEFLNCETNFKWSKSLIKESGTEYEYQLSNAEDNFKKEIKSILLLPAASNYLGKDLSVFTEEELDKISYDLIGLLKFLVNRH
jgi:transcriptional regulator with XRE-family HTH domain